jgi:hypothetical protein
MFVLPRSREIHVYVRIYADPDVSSGDVEEEREKQHEEFAKRNQ